MSQSRRFRERSAVLRASYSSLSARSDSWSEPLTVLDDRERHIFEARRLVDPPITNIAVWGAASYCAGVV